MNINEAFQAAVKARMEKRNISMFAVAQGTDAAESSVYAFFKPGHRVTLLMAGKIADAIKAPLPLIIKEAQELVKEAEQ